MTLDSDAKFEEKLFFGLKSNMRNLEIFTRVLVSLKMGTLMEFFSPKLKIFKLKFTRELCVMRMKNDAKLKRN